MKTSLKPSFFQTAASQYKARAKELKRKKFKLKAKLYLTIVLPAFLIILFTKVLKTYLAIKVRSIFTKPDLAVEKDERKNAEPILVQAVPVQRKD